jgi:hypothetical protein
MQPAILSVRDSRVHLPVANICWEPVRLCCGDHFDAGNGNLELGKSVNRNYLAVTLKTAFGQLLFRISCIATYCFNPPRNLVLQHRKHRVQLHVGKASLCNHGLQIVIHHDNSSDGYLRHAWVVHGDNGVRADQIRVAQPSVWVLVDGTISDEEIDEHGRVDLVLWRTKVDLVEILGR